MEGVEIASKKFKDMLLFFSKLKDNDVIIYCYRGGMHSESVVALCNSLGFSFYKLEGGYKAYRQHVNTYFIKLYIHCTDSYYIWACWFW